MKSVPIVAAVVIGAFLGYCVLNDTFWPVKGSLEWQPAWWQCQYLFGLGLLLMVPCGIVIQGLRDIGIQSNLFLSLLFWIFLFISIVIVSSISGLGLALLQRIVVAFKSR